MVGLLVLFCGYVAVDLIRHLLWDGPVFIHLLIELQTVIFIEDKL